MILTDTDEKNSRVVDLLMEAIEMVHGELRPYIIIFPGKDDDTLACSMTNLDDVDTVKALLSDCLDSLGEVDEMITLTATDNHENTPAPRDLLPLDVPGVCPQLQEDPPGQAPDPGARPRHRSSH